MTCTSRKKDDKCADAQRSNSVKTEIRSERGNTSKAVDTKRASHRSMCIREPTRRLGILQTGSLMSHLIVHGHGHQPSPRPST